MIEPTSGSRWSWTDRRGTLLFGVAAIASVGAKVWLARLGHNFDVESWAIFAELIDSGKNVYAETYRNPYGPVWAYVCAAAAQVVSGAALEDFHRVLALFLSLVDVGIAFLLARRFGLVAGVLFLVNPVSLLISGFHTQFGNLAVLLALAACLLLDRDKGSSPAPMAAAMALIGISLATKHILIFLPLWFVMRPGCTRRVRAGFLAPYAIFALGFAPFVVDERGLEGVVEHVFLYQGFHLDAFFPYIVRAFVPLGLFERLFAWVPIFSGFKLVWLGAMMLAGFAVRRKTFTEQLLIYLVAMVVFSSASADQYLAIPLAACAVYWKHLTMWWYVVVSTIYLGSSSANIGMLPAMAGYADVVRKVGLERWHPVAALLVFVAAYWLTGRSKRSASHTSTMHPGHGNHA